MLGFADRLIAKLGAPGNYGDMGVGGYCKLLEGIRAAGLDAKFDAGAFEEKLRKLVNASIVRDTSMWEGYSVRPSDYIASPGSIFYEGNEEIVSTELDYLIETHPAGGVWDITWSWFENTEKYPQEFAVSRNWWRACKAIEKISFLKRFGRVE